MTAIDRLKALLCDPAGKCCIDGSDEDRRLVDEALATLEAEAKAVDGGELTKRAHDALAASVDGQAKADIVTLRDSLLHIKTYRQLYDHESLVLQLAEALCKPAAERGECDCADWGMTGHMPNCPANYPTKAVDDGELAESVRLLRWVADMKTPVGIPFFQRYKMPEIPVWLHTAADQLTSFIALTAKNERLKINVAAELNARKELEKHATEWVAELERLREENEVLRLAVEDCQMCHGGTK